MNTEISNLLQQLNKFISIAVQGLNEKDKAKSDKYFNLSKGLIERIINEHKFI